MIIGVLGGTFDPPHLGHLILASEALYQFGLEKVLFVLTPNPPHKKGLPITDVTFRKTMLELAIEGNPSFELSPVDLERDPPHYAADTMGILKGQYPEFELYYLMGGDSLRDLPSWNRPLQFLDNCDGLAVMARDRWMIDLNALEQRLPGIGQKIHWLNSTRIEISSREIRQRVSENLPYRYFLPEKVYRFIKEHHIYKQIGGNSSG
jgi:nicotinate-nucleotide adenylyltransferase